MSYVVTWLRTDVNGKASAKAFGPYPTFDLANSRRCRLLAIEAGRHRAPRQRAQVHVAELDGSGSAS